MRVAHLASGELTGIQNRKHPAEVNAHILDAIDDTGTGQNGLSYVQKLGLSTIKIDKLFVDSVAGDVSARSVIEMLVRLANQLGMVAEAVETAQQIAALATCGVDKASATSPPRAGAQAFLSR